MTTKNNVSDKTDLVWSGEFQDHGCLGDLVDTAPRLAITGHSTRCQSIRQIKMTNQDCRRAASVSWREFRCRRADAAALTSK